MQKSEFRRTPILENSEELVTEGENGNDTMVNSNLNLISNALSGTTGGALLGSGLGIIGGIVGGILGGIITGYSGYRAHLNRNRKRLFYPSQKS